MKCLGRLFSNYWFSLTRRGRTHAGNRASRNCTDFRRTNASGTEFMMVRFYGNDFGVGIATHDAAAHHQLQAAHLSQ